MGRSTASVVAFSTVTGKGQTTVPKAIRDILGTDRLSWLVDGDGTVSIRAARPSSQQDDPAIGAYLALLERDIRTGANLRSDLPEPLIAAIERAAAIAPTPDYDAPLSGDDDLPEF